jgi:hypothetical protein
MYELPEDVSYVPEHVTRVRLSYVLLFDFINEYFSLVLAVVINRSCHLCCLHWVSTHHKFLSCSFRSCMGLFWYPWTRWHHLHRRVTIFVLFFERFLQPFRSEIAKFWMASVVLLCTVLCLVTCCMFPEQKSPTQITANKCFAVVLAQHLNTLRYSLRALHCPAVWCLQ